MAQYKDVIVNAGAGGFGGPLVLKPDDKKNKVVNITGGVISPVSQKIAELTGCELVDGFKTSVAVHFVAVSILKNASIQST